LKGENIAQREILIIASNREKKKKHEKTATSESLFSEGEGSRPDKTER